MPAGILSATLANHLAAGFIGAWFGGFLDRIVLDMVVGVSMIVMALWALKPDKLCEDGVPVARRGVFIGTLMAFFIAEIGDKTQVATVALAAAYSSLAAVVIGTTAGMLAANLPVVLLGNLLARKLPMRAIHIGASVLFAALGLLFVLRALTRLAPFEDRLGDVRGEIAEAHNPSEIGSAHSVAHGKRSKGDVLVPDERRVEPTCPNEQLDHLTHAGAVRSTWR